MQNPYASPTAPVADEVIADELYQPRMFSTEGRIGRLRYFVYSMVVQFVTTFAVGIAAGILMALLTHRSDSAALLVPLLIIIYIPIFAVAFIMAKRRLNDLNQSGWLSLLFLVPLVNLFFALYLLFWPGTRGSNNYGPAPTKNSLALVLFGVVLPLLLIGMLAAIAIPAYHDFQQRAQAAAAMQPAP